MAAAIGDLKRLVGVDCSHAKMSVKFSPAEITNDDVIEKVLNTR